MGYTHYWNIAPAFTQEQIIELAEDARSIILASEIPIGDVYGERKEPDLGPDRIGLNGIGDDSHETFAIKAGDEGFDFTKTAQKPYDVVVTAILIAAVDRFGPQIRLTSDGDPVDWEPGLVLANRALARPLAMPVIA